MFSSNKTMNSGGFEVVRRQGVLPPDTTRGITKRRTKQKPIFDDTGAIVAGLVGAGVLAFAAGEGLLALKYGPEESLRMQAALVRQGASYATRKGFTLARKATNKAGVLGTKAALGAVAITAVLGKEFGAGVVQGVKEGAREAAKEYASSVPLVRSAVDLANTAQEFTSPLVQSARSLADTARQGVQSSAATLARAGEAAQEAFTSATYLSLKSMYNQFKSDPQEEEMRRTVERREKRRRLARQFGMAEDDSDDDEEGDDLLNDEDDLVGVINNIQDRSRTVAQNLNTVVGMAADDAVYFDALDEGDDDDPLDALGPI